MIRSPTPLSSPGFSGRALNLLPVHSWPLTVQPYLSSTLVLSNPYTLIVQPYLFSTPVLSKPYTLIVQPYLSSTPVLSKPYTLTHSSTLPLLYSSII